VSLPNQQDQVGIDQRSQAGDRRVADIAHVLWHRHAVRRHEPGPRALL
ncbi:MAG: hypothetical protein AVDCRST_MAG77-2549, partial [uncultured Chloroflexi bacterium]